MDKIIIKPGPTADSRSCDSSQVSRETLLHSSYQHITDVQQGMLWFIQQLIKRAKNHDFTKIKYFDDFYRDFQNNFKTTDWYNLHKSKQRHHIDEPDGQRQDIDLIDVIEYIVDGIMAGISRWGQYHIKQLPDELLQKAYRNTIQKLLDIIELQKE